MNARHWLMTGCIALFIPAAVLAQPGGFGGGRGGFGGGQGGFQGGGAGRRGGGGGGRSMFSDPDQMFDRISNGKDSVDLNSLEGIMRTMTERMLQSAGVTPKNGIVTRQEYKTAFEKFRSSMASGNFGGFGGAGGGRQRGAGRGQNNEDEANAEFDKLDTDKDGQLSAAEMTGTYGESLLAERDKWDSNQDGIISRAEFQSFYAARKRQQQNENKGSDRSAREDRAPRDNANPDGRSIIVYRADNVPKEVSSFFSKYDTDQDAQISLYEWRMGGGDIDEFKKMDRSGDNLLTVEEALLYVHLHQDSTIAAAAGDASGNRRGGMFGGNSGPGRTVNFTMPGGFSRTGGGGQFPGRGNFQGPGGFGGQNGFNRNRGGDTGNGDTGNGFSRNRGGRGDSGGSNRGGGNRGGRGGRRGGFGGGNDNGGGND